MNESIKSLLKSKYVLALGVCAILLIVLILIAYLTASKTATAYNTQSNNSSSNISSSATNSVDAYFTDKNVKIQKGSEYEISLAVKTKNDTVIQGYESYVNFDKSNISITGITVVTGTPSVSLSDTNDTLSSVNTKGTIKLLSEIQSATGLTLKGNVETVLVKIKFKALTSTASKIALSTSQPSNLYVVDSSNNISKSSFTPLNGTDLTN